MIIFAEVSVMEYRVNITPQMRAVNQVLLEECIGVDHCIFQRGRNTIVEAPKKDTAHIIMVLKRHFTDVADIRKAYLMLEDLHDFILVKPLVSEAPLSNHDAIPIPSVEKTLVDCLADREYASLSDAEIQQTFQRAFEIYHVNTSRLLRYAGRKGKKEEVRHRMNKIDQGRISIVHTIQDFFLGEPVKRAWLFGSFSRMEERPDSDIDILVDIDASKHVGLLYYAGMVNNLEKLLDRKIDLVTDGTLKPFANESVNHDKVLIYERT